MKPSPYFADKLRYFFKRFASDASLKKWFLKQAGDFSSSFFYEKSLPKDKKILVFLPQQKEQIPLILAFFKKMEFPKENILALVDESFRELLLRESKTANFIYTNVLKFRYGESDFSVLTEKVKEFRPHICLYFNEAFFPSLYLAKISSAIYRIGFSADTLYPFLNISLKAPSFESGINLLEKQFGEIYG